MEEERDIGLMLADPSTIVQRNRRLWLENKQAEIFKEAVLIMIMNKQFCKTYFINNKFDKKNNFFEVVDAPSDS